MSCRQTPTAETLFKNNIYISDKPDKKNWPDYVKDLEKRLIGSFAKLIPGSKHVFEIESDVWGPGGLPTNAVDRESINHLLEPKERMLEFAQEQVYSDSKKYVKRKTSREDQWCTIWGKIFENQIIKGQKREARRKYNPFELVSDQLFTNKTSTHVWNCELTQPKPDHTLAFTTFCVKETCDPKEHIKRKCFVQATLDGLLSHEKCKLLSSPFNRNKSACFPWAVFEGKSARRAGARTAPLAECQVANAAVKCLEILESLKATPQGRWSKNLDTRQELPIPCFTCEGQSLEKIFRGDMTELWSCVQLLHIVENLRKWALDVFKPWVDEHLTAWIEFMNTRKGSAHQLQSLGVLLLRYRHSKLSQHLSEEDRQSDVDSGIYVGSEETKRGDSKSKSLSIRTFEDDLVEDSGCEDDSAEDSASEEEFDDSGFYEPEDESEEEQVTNKPEVKQANEPVLRRSSRIRNNPKYMNGFSYKE